MALGMLPVRVALYYRTEAENRIRRRIACMRLDIPPPPPTAPHHGPRAHQHRAWDSSTELKEIEDKRFQINFDA